MSTVILALLLSLSAAARGDTALASPQQGTSSEGHTMFTLTGTSASLEPAGGENAYTLVLQGVAPTVVWFEDRPKRGSGITPTETYLKNFPFGISNPPNAALVASFSSNRSEDAVVVLTLSSPIYDAEAAELRFNATILFTELEELRVVKNYVGHATRVEPDIDLSSVTSVALFIDDCPDFTAKCNIDCYINAAPIQVQCGSFTWGMKWVCAFCYPAAWEDANNDECPFIRVAFDPDVYFPSQACANGWWNTPWDQPNGLPMVTNFEPDCEAHQCTGTVGWGFGPYPHYVE